MAIITIETIAAVFKQCPELAMVTIARIDALITSLAFCVEVEAIGAITRMHNPVGIEDIFGIKAGGIHEAVFVVAGVICEFGGGAVFC